MIQRLLEIAIREEELKEVRATENDKSVIWERIELQNEKRRLMPRAALQSDFLKVSHRSRF